MESSKNSNMSYGSHQQFEPPILSTNKNHRRLYSAAELSKTQMSKTNHKTGLQQHISQKSMTHNQRLAILANQKLTELLKFDESTNTFKIFQPKHRKQSTNTYLDQKLEVSHSTKNASKFTNHVNRRHENLTKQQVIYHKLYNEQRQRAKYSYSNAQMPTHMSRSSISKMLNPNFKVDEDRKGTSSVFEQKKGSDYEY